MYVHMYVFIHLCIQNATHAYSLCSSIYVRACLLIELWSNNSSENVLRPTNVYANGRPFRRQISVCDG